MSWAETLASLRAEGWSVAVHNDYQLAGNPMTFWLLTHPSGVWTKGEGPTDDIALTEARTLARKRIGRGHIEYVPNPEQGTSYGLEFPFMLCQQGYGRFVVYLRSSGQVVWQSNPNDNRCLAEIAAKRECERLNGILGQQVDTGLIDSTP